MLNLISLNPLLFSYVCSKQKSMWRKFWKNVHSKCSMNDAEIFINQVQMFYSGMRDCFSREFIDWTWAQYWIHGLACWVIYATWNGTKQGLTHVSLKYWTKLCSKTIFCLVCMSVCSTINLKWFIKF